MFVTSKNKRAFYSLELTPGITELCGHFWSKIRTGLPPGVFSAHSGRKKLRRSHCSCGKCDSVFAHRNELHPSAFCVWGS